MIAPLKKIGYIEWSGVLGKKDVRDCWPILSQLGV
jgi:hypothetical protein